MATLLDNIETQATQETQPTQPTQPTEVSNTSKLIPNPAWEFYTIFKEITKAMYFFYALLFEQDVRTVTKDDIPGIAILKLGKKMGGRLLQGFTSGTGNPKGRIEINSLLLQKDSAGNLLLPKWFIFHILFHEMVHFYCYEESQRTGKKIPAHGKVFKTIMQKNGINIKKNGSLDSLVFENQNNFVELLQKLSIPCPEGASYEKDIAPHMEKVLGTSKVKIAKWTAKTAQIQYLEERLMSAHKENQELSDMLTTVRTEIKTLKEQAQQTTKGIVVTESEKAMESQPNVATPAKPTLEQKILARILMTPEGKPENGYVWSYKNPSAVVFSIQELAKMTTVTHNGRKALMKEFSDIIRTIRETTPNIAVSALQLRNALKQMGFLTFETNRRKEVESITIITAKIAEVLS